MFFGKLKTRLLFASAGVFLCMEPSMARLHGDQPASKESKIEFRAEKYVRDSRNDSVSGTGNAWTKKGDREMYADEIHVDFTSQLAIGTGNVKIKFGDVNIWSSSATISLSGQEATFEDATLFSESLVMTGKRMRKLDAKNYDIDQATYSNCNINNLDADIAAACPQDWRISGRRAHVEINGYAHLYDVIIQTKLVPVFYIPYIILPVKSKRKTGLLPLKILNSSALGTGISVPYFTVINEWQDLHSEYTYYTRAGSHLSLRYRYLYSDVSKGNLGLFFAGQKFGLDADPSVQSASPKWLGLFGEGSVSLHNIYTFGDLRGQSRQMINWVTHPYYSFNYGGDLHPRADLGYLRNQITVTQPSDNWFFAFQSQYFQSLVVSQDSGSDNGPVFQLPTLTADRVNSHGVGKYVSYEIDSQFTNFYRKTDYDNIPDTIVYSGPQTITDFSFNGRDYVRTGRRLQLEPRLIVNTPMPQGFQLQPVLAAGTLLYHFSIPNSQVLPRYYLQTEIPFSFQVQRTFSTSWPDFERIQHVMQPRIIFASKLYSNAAPDHAFFRRSSSEVSNPPFDAVDPLPDYQYLRFEWIHRLRARSNGTWRRFFLLQASEQYNIMTDPYDPRYKNHLGPIEVIASMGLGKLSWQLQALYPLELTSTLNGAPITPVRQATLGTGVSWDDFGSNVIRANVALYKSADPALTNQTLSLYWYKYLPLFFDLEGQLEYNILKGTLRSYGMGFYFRRKPKSCWYLSLKLLRNAYGLTTTDFAFGFDFGA